MTKRKSHDGTEILYHRFLKDDPNAQAQVRQAIQDRLIAQQIYDLRTAAGLTQKQLAERVGTSQSAIVRLEDANYPGYTLKTLQRVAAALGKQLDIRFIDASPLRGSPESQTGQAASQELELADRAAELVEA